MIVYMSFIGNTKKLVEKLPYESLNLNDERVDVVDSDYVVAIPTYTRGKTKKIEQFIAINRYRLKGVIGVGNLNFGEDFVYVAKDIANKYKVPLLHKVEYEGTQDDVDYIVKELSKHGIT